MRLTRFELAVRRTVLRATNAVRTAVTTTAPTEPVTAPDPEDIYTADEMPAAEDIDAAAREYDRAADQARRADRGKRAAKKILNRLPAGTYGSWIVERIPSSRQTADLDTIRALFKQHGLGPVPMKPAAPSLRVTRSTEATAIEVRELTTV